MKVVILSALGHEVAERCRASLLDTAHDGDFDIHLAQETGFREQTLNQALEQVGTDQDILFIGDDIVFTPGWHEALLDNIHQADILGMTMLYPQTNMIQDRGYDLVEGDGHVSLVAQDRGSDKGLAQPFGFRHCDAVCGCFLYVKASVLAQVSNFSEQGQNRWGEFIFICNARRCGFTCGVVEHYLYHGGISTKSNPDRKLSSTSYLVENSWWQDIVGDHVDPSWVRVANPSCLHESLTTPLAQKGLRALFYGAGTVAEIIFKTMGDDLVADVDFVTGLDEEIGLNFQDHVLQGIQTTDFSRYDLILMTPLRIGEKLFHQLIKSQLPQDFPGRVLIIEAREKGSCRELLGRIIPVRS